MALTTTVQAWIARIMKLKPVRVFQHYAAHRGPLLSQGLSYQAIFAVFAAIGVGFSILGSVLQSRPDLLDALIRLISANAPGLIDDGSGEGAIDPDQLVQSVPFTLTGAIALALLLFTATGWLSSGREAVRALFDLPSATLNPVLAWLKDLGLALAFGAALLLSASLSVVSTTATAGFLDGLGVEAESAAARLVTTVVGILLMLVLDVAIMAAFFRIVSGIRIPFRVLWQGVVIGAVALGVLKVLGSSLLGGATSNPLLASFAVIIGLLIWFTLICQVILLSAAWIAVSATDAGLDLHGKPAATLPATVGGAQ
jgi:membrane protein